MLISAGRLRSVICRNPCANVDAVVSAINVAFARVVPMPPLLFDAARTATEPPSRGTSRPPPNMLRHANTRIIMARSIMGADDEISDDDSALAFADADADDGLCANLICTDGSGTRASTSSWPARCATSCDRSASAKLAATDMSCDHSCAYVESPRAELEPAEPLTADDPIARTKSIHEPISSCGANASRFAQNASCVMLASLVLVDEMNTDELALALVEEEQEDGNASDDGSASNGS